jgi:hypothetical protein
MENQKPYNLEEIPFGTAKLRVLRTRQGEYGLHGQTGWDDLPYWEFYDAWIVTVQTYGYVDWMFKYRKNAKTEYTGKSKINILETNLLKTEAEAEDKALTIAGELEEKGFKIEIEIGEENEARNLGRNYAMEEIPKGLVLRRFQPRIIDVYLPDEMN